MNELATIQPGNRLSLAGMRGFATQPAVARALPALGLLGVAGAAALAWSVLSAAPQRAVSTGMDDSEKAAVVDALGGAGIANTVDRGTGAVTVGEDDYHRARMILAQEGLPKGAPDGNSLLDTMPMGASRAVEDQRLRSAREQDLARTIEAIDAVKSARVHLALETSSVFVRDRAAPAASVMLALASGRRLTDAQVGAIAHLVSASVSGLDPAEVSIVDQNGRLLSRGGASDPVAAASDRQLEVQERVEARLAGALGSLLTPIVGPDNFSAEVHADLDFAEVQATRESFPKDGATVTRERVEAMREPGAGANGVGGIPGAISNQPPPASQLSTTPIAAGGAMLEAAGAPGDRTQQSADRSFALGREVSVTREAVGVIKRVSVAVALRKPSDGAPIGVKRVAEIEQLVKGAVGFDGARGDTVAVTVQPFAERTETAAAWYEAPWIMTAARIASGVIVALLLLLFIGRPLLRRHLAASKERAEERKARRQAIGVEMRGALAQQVRNPSSPAVTVDMIEAAPGYAARAELIRDFVRQDPARAALVVRDLLRAGEAKEASNG